MEVIPLEIPGIKGSEVTSRGGGGGQGVTENNYRLENSENL